MTSLCGNASAQNLDIKADHINWIEYAKDVSEIKDTYDSIYICHAYKNGDEIEYSFINAGSSYGACAILANRGMVFTIERSNDLFHFKSLIQNDGSGSYMGKFSTLSYKVAIDRGKNNTLGTNWGVSRISDNLSNTLFGKSTGKAYHIRRYYALSYHNYLYGVREAGKVGRVMLESSSTPANEAWLFVKKDDVNTAIKNQEGQKQQLIDVSGLLGNTRFVRNAYSGFWKFYDYDEYIANGPDDSYRLLYDINRGALDGADRELQAYISMDPRITSGSSVTYAENYGRFGAAGMKDKVCMAQKVSGLLPGTYLVTAQAFFADDEDEADAGKAPISNAYLYASTTGIHNSVRIPKLSSGEQNVFNGYVGKHRDVLANNISYFRYNVPASEYLGRGGVFSLNATDHDIALDESYKLVQVAVMVRPDKDADGNDKETGHLIVSIAKTADAGRVYLNNVKVYYAGPYEFGVDAYNREYDKIDGQKYLYPQRFNLRRDFGVAEDITVENGDLQQWEPLVLPVDVPASEIRTAFGGFSTVMGKLADVKLSRLVGLSDDGRQIKFKKVDFSYISDIAIEAGECYIIKVSRAPVVDRNGSYYFKTSFQREKENADELIKYGGPIYYFTALTRDKDLSSLIAGKGAVYNDGIVTREYTSSNGEHTLKFTGCFCRPADGAPAGSYVMSGGSIYHLSQPWAKLMGTCWYLEVESDCVSTPAGLMSFSFGYDDEGGATAVRRIPSDDGGRAAVRGTYNLSGQRIASDDAAATLPKGIYIRDGKKFVVR